MNDNLTEDNFIIYAAKHYDNPNCHNTEEFYEDLNRFKYLRRLFKKYNENNELKERLILNHIIILYNLFGSESTTKMLFLKMEGFEQYLKPFLVFLNYMPDVITGINGKNIYSSDIPLDLIIIKALRRI